MKNEKLKGAFEQGIGGSAALQILSKKTAEEKPAPKRKRRALKPDSQKKVKRIQLVLRTVDFDALKELQEISGLSMNTAATRAIYDALHAAKVQLRLKEKELA